MTINSLFTSLVVDAEIVVTSVISCLHVVSSFLRHRQNINRSHASGLAFGFSQAIVFFAYAACFSFGAWLIDQGTITYEDMFKYVLLLVCLNDVKTYLLCF